MKSIFLTALCSSILFSSFNCSSPQKPDPKIEACKNSCGKKMEQCVKKAANNEAKKAACEAVGNKCGRDCSSKK